tara:strand:+ start:8779 stop:8961 length:183 start_codon:yes stop_codon:yes gene_type:complete
MGPIKSFQNNYLEDLNKRRKTKRETFGTSTKRTVEGIIQNKKLSQEPQNEIIDHSRKEKD